MTPAEKAVIAAAVAWRCDSTLDELQALDKLDAAVAALLREDPRWGEKEEEGKR